MRDQFKIVAVDGKHYVIHNPTGLRSVAYRDRETAELILNRIAKDMDAMLKERLQKGKDKTNLYLVEYYQINPVTKETGWAIAFAWVRAKSKGEVAGKIEEADPLFDEVITVGSHYETFLLDTKGSVIFC